MCGWEAAGEDPDVHKLWRREVAIQQQNGGLQLSGVHG